MSQTFSLFSLIRQDFRAAREGRQGTATTLRTILFARGFQLLASHRLQHALLNVPVIGRLFARILWWLTTTVYGCEIAPEATLGGGLRIPHAVGLVIGSGVQVGTGCILYQNITLGLKKPDVPAYPTLGNNVVVSAGAVVVGGIKIGQGATIGANAVVTQNVPARALAVGVPAVIKKAKA